MPTADTPVPRQLSEEERALWEKADAATAGPWVPLVIVQGGLVEFPEASDHFVVGSYPVDGGGSVLAICGPTRGEDAAKSLADAEFVAACNPSVILSLLTALSSEREAGETDGVLDAFLIERDALKKQLADAAERERLAFVNGYAAGFNTGAFEPDLSPEDVYGGAAHKADEYLNPTEPAHD